MVSAPNTVSDSGKTGVDRGQQPTLHAVYTSPHPPAVRTFHHLIATVSHGDVPTKRAYLAELRGLVTTLQGGINTFLTERMEEDQRAVVGQGQEDAEQEAKEEQNYGEEVVGSNS